MKQEPEIDAVVLSLGESTLPRAIQSLKEQSYPVARVVQIENVSPFHRAFSCGVPGVSAPFFLQLDADMVLDRNCLSELLRKMQRSVAVVVGLLRDPLLGPIPGVKLFRTQTVRTLPFRDVLSPDTDFLARAENRGWGTVFIRVPETVGEHRPQYESSAYTFHKFRLEGSRYRARGEVSPFRWYVRNLSESLHPSRYWALAGLALGFFEPWEGDKLMPHPHDPAHELVRERLTNRRLTVPPSLFGWGVGSFDQVYRRCLNRPDLAVPLTVAKSEGPFDWLVTLAAARSLSSSVPEPDCQTLKSFLSQGIVETWRQWYWWCK
ncbi:MAG: glycosyltransferase [Candidatus Eremiobacteraeota bacterium]|nr:glycosyltransferase [Candidatus Eremiobacteraeota bacterium]